jgi:hypothetical protein
MLKWNCVIWREFLDSIEFAGLGRRWNFVNTALWFFEDTIDLVGLSVRAG